MPFYDYMGQPISLLQWARLKEYADNHPIVQSWDDGRALRTRWRGMNLSCCKDALVLFETTFQDRNGHEEVIKQHSHDRHVAESVHHSLRREMELTGEAREGETTP